MDRNILGESEFTIYPNPVNGKLYIESEKEINIEISNSFGQIIFQEKISSQKNEIDVSRLVRGIYFVKIITGENSVVRKIILE